MSDHEHEQQSEATSEEREETMKALDVPEGERTTSRAVAQKRSKRSRRLGALKRRQHERSRARAAHEETSEEREETMKDLDVPEDESKDVKGGFAKIEYSK